MLRRYGAKLLDYNLATHGPLQDMMAPSVKFKTAASTASSHEIASDGKKTTTNGAPASSARQRCGRGPLMLTAFLGPSSSLFFKVVAQVLFSTAAVIALLSSIAYYFGSGRTFREYVMRYTDEVRAV